MSAGDVAGGHQQEGGLDECGGASGLGRPRRGGGSAAPPPGPTSPASPVASWSASSRRANVMCSYSRRYVRSSSAVTPAAAAQRRAAPRSPALMWSRARTAGTGRTLGEKSLLNRRSASASSASAAARSPWLSRSRAIATRHRYGCCGRPAASPRSPARCRCWAVSSTSPCSHATRDNATHMSAVPRTTAPVPCAASSAASTRASARLHRVVGRVEVAVLQLELDHRHRAPQRVRDVPRHRKPSGRGQVALPC